MRAGELLHGHAGLRQDRRREAALLLEQRRQQVFDIDLLVAVPYGLRLRGPDGFLQFFGKAIEVHSSILIHSFPGFRTVTRTLFEQVID